MNNFYFGFKGNVFSKMFMMVAIFMAMSSSLYGAVGDLSAKTVGDGNGSLKAIKIRFENSNGNSYSIKSNAEKYNQLKDLFTIKNGTTTYPITGYGGDAEHKLIADSPANTVGTYFNPPWLYLFFDAKGDTNDTLNVTYATKNNKTAGNIDGTSTSGQKVDSTDGAPPVIRSVVATMDYPKSVVITFSEKINDSIINGSTSTTSTLNANSLVVITENSSSDDSNLTNKTPLASLNNNKNILTLSISNEANFIVDNKVLIKTHTNVINLKDLADNKPANDINSTGKQTITNAPPSIISARLDINSSLSSPENNRTNYLHDEYISVKFNENIKYSNSNNDNSQVSEKSFTIHYKSKEYNITGAPSITSYDPSKINLRLLGTNLAKLKIALADLNATDINISMNRDNDINITDYSGTDINDSINEHNLSHSLSYFEKDTTPAIVNRAIFHGDKNITIEFTDPVKLSTTLAEWNSSIAPYMMYDGNSTEENLSSIVSSDDNRTFEFEFDNNLSQGDTIQMVLGAGNATNYSGIANLEINKSIALVDSTPPRIKAFTLDMLTGVILIKFDQMSVSEVLDIANCTIDKISLNKNSSTLTLGSSMYKQSPSCVTASSNKELNISLEDLGLNTVRAFLGVQATGDTVTLDLNVSNLRNDSVNEDVASKLTIPLEGSFVPDTTKPELVEWNFDLINKKILVYFDTPISLTTGTSDKFIIAKDNSSGSGTDTFNTYNSIAVTDDASVNIISDGSDNNKSVLEFSLTSKFMKAILDDGDIATTRDNAYLRIISGNLIKNISTVGDEVDSTIGQNSKKVNKFDKNGNVHIAFTKKDGVRFLTENENISVKENTWYHRTVPNGVTTTLKNLRLSIFDSAWEYSGTSWKIPSLIESNKGYWFKTKRSLAELDYNATLATYDPDDVETKNELFTRIKDNGTSYKLIGITHDLNQSHILDQNSTGCHVFYHHYDLKDDGNSSWDIRYNIQAGEAIWVRQYCP